jgi:hypothetical protein
MFESETSNPEILTIQMHSYADAMQLPIDMREHPENFVNYWGEKLRQAMLKCKSAIIGLLENPPIKGVINWASKKFNLPKDYAEARFFLKKDGTSERFMFTVQNYMEKNPSPDKVIYDITSPEAFTKLY